MKRVSLSDTECFAESKATRTNHILSLLSEEAHARLEPHLELVHLETDKVIYRPGHKRIHAYFPTTCVFAVQQFDANSKDGCVGLVSKTGMLGLSSILKNPLAPNQAMVQMGGHAWRIPVELLEREFFRGGELMHLLLPLAYFNLTQTAQRVVCSQHHQLEQQVCDWLIHLQDIGEHAHIPITQQKLADLIGVRRQGVSETLSLLKSNSLLDYRNGRITLSNRPQIEQLRCGCHQMVAQEHKRLFSRHLNSQFGRSKVAQNDDHSSKKAEALAGAMTNGGVYWLDCNLITGQISKGGGRPEVSLLGYAPGTFNPTLQDWDQLVHPEDRPMQLAAREAHFKRGLPYLDTEYRIRHRDGHWIWVCASGKVVERDANGRPLRYVGILRDLTERKKAEQAMERLTRTDHLTQAANRLHFFDQGEREVSRALRHGTDLSLLSMDMDHFKHVNDTFGHAAGDQVLQRFADLVKSHLRLTDLFARLGGEEFCLLLPHTDHTAAYIIAQRILESVRAQTVDTESGAVRYTVSMGVSALSPRIQNLPDLYKAADQAMYRAKRLGRDRVEAAVDR